MKDVINASIGGRSFNIENDAYDRLNLYLKDFEAVLSTMSDVSDNGQTKEIMSDIEDRIAELLLERQHNECMAVSLEQINAIVAQLGMPDGSPEPSQQESHSGYDSSVRTDDSTVNREKEDNGSNRTYRKLYRDPDDRILGGVCSGLAHYFNIDRTILRVLLVIAILFPVKYILALFMLWGIAGMLPFIYIILWIAMPKAKTPAEKCLMRGLKPTAENMAKFYR